MSSQRLSDLVLNASHVVLDAMDGDELLPVVQEPATNRRIGQEEPKHRSPEDGEAAKDDE